MNNDQLKTQFNKEYFLLFFLIIITFISRYCLIKDGFVPFQFDHGKDSLAVLDMWLNKNPRLIGPWTSIPGLYFWQALQGKKLPVDFSYQKDELSYIVQKTELLNYFQTKQGREEAQLNYFIIEPANIIEFQNNWWNSFGITSPSTLEEIPNQSELKIYKQALAL